MAYYTAETQSLRDPGAVGQKLVNRTVRITRPEISALTVDELLRARQWRVIFGRTLRNGEMILADGLPDGDDHQDSADAGDPVIVAVRRHSVGSRRLWSLSK